MQFVLQQGFIHKPLNFDAALILNSFHAVCSPNTCKGVFNPNVTTFQLSHIVLSVCTYMCTLVLFITK